MTDRAQVRHGPRAPHPGALTLNLDRAVRARIDEQAAAEGVRPWELISRWIIERLRDDTMVDERDEMWGEIDSLRDRLGAVEQHLTRLEQRPSRPRRERAQQPLHMVIAGVLNEAGKPLSITEITSAIRDRGLFSGPRNGRPPTTSMISSRVAHAAYRAAFRREGNVVELAIPYDQLAAGKAITNGH